ncbi:hypothetical protein ACFQ14_04795 [Pseudahrensia aquimaris]|uniref:DUF3072 domain-containing protein n=1 Tax=Pseudahrensia aquimaris TaxID=744461 RepID=A0ABW3FH60_9HYPH
MKSDSNKTIVGMPKEARIDADDNYLSEMTDRLHRLRTLTGEDETPLKRAKSRTTAKKDAPSY